MKCSKCGAEIPSDSKFCVECGTPVPVEEQRIARLRDEEERGVKCPHCGSTRLQMISDVHGDGVNALKLCCCGFFGLCGAGHTETTHYWVCQTCGQKFKV